MPRPYLGRFSSVVKDGPSLHNGDFSVSITAPDWVKGDIMGVSLDTATVPNTRPNIYEDTSMHFAYENYSSTVQAALPPLNTNFTVYVQSDTQTSEGIPVFVTGATLGGAATPDDEAAAYFGLISNAINTATGLATSFTIVTDEFENATITLNGMGTRTALLPLNDTPLSTDIHISSPARGIVWKTKFAMYAPYIVIPTGQYTIGQLMDTLEAEFLAGGYTVTVDFQSDANQKMRFTSDTYNLVLYGGEMKQASAKLVGVTEDVLGAGMVTDAQSYADLTGDTFIYIMSNLSNHNRTLDSRFGVVKQLGVIECGDFGTYKTVHYEGASQTPYLLYPSVDGPTTITFQLQDAIGNVIDPGSANCFFLVRFFPISDDI